MPSFAALAVDTPAGVIDLRFQEGVCSAIFEGRSACEWMGFRLFLGQLHQLSLSSRKLAGLAGVTLAIASFPLPWRPG